MARCGRCGRKLPAGSVNCPHCGSFSRCSEHRRSSAYWLLGVLLLLAVLLAVIFTT